jgi:hypothetical protein
VRDRGFGIGNEPTAQCPLRGGRPSVWVFVYVKRTHVRHRRRCAPNRRERRGGEHKVNRTIQNKQTERERERGRTATRAAANTAPTAAHFRGGEERTSKSRSAARVSPSVPRAAAHQRSSSGLIPVNRHAVPTARLNGQIVVRFAPATARAHDTDSVSDGGASEREGVWAVGCVHDNAEEAVDTPRLTPRIAHNCKMTEQQQ